MPSTPARWRPLRSVRSRILASMLAVAAAGMLVAGATAYLVQRERILGAVDDRLASAVDEVSFIVSDTPGATLDEALAAIVQRLRPGTDETAFALTPAGTALVPGGSIDFRLEQDTAFVDRVLEETTAQGSVRGTAQTTERLVRYIAVPVGTEDDAARGVFVFAIDLDSTLAPLTDAFRTFAVVALISLVVVGLVGWFVSGRLLAPIRRLRETAARITASDVSERIEVSGNDDVSDLAGTVNGMLDRLDGALTGQRQLLDDVGHELKTPITIVRGHLELLDPDDARDVAATRALAIDELDRMSGLVKDIADLAQAQRPLVLRPEPTDITALTERVRAKALALSPAHQWVIARSAPGIAVVDPERLTQALLQLAANAVAHGGASVIELGSERLGDRLRVWLRDDGVGIPLSSQEIIFERFRRGATGRGSSGSGLGLAIVSAIARAHGGTVAVTSLPGAGATFTLDIPWITPEGSTP